MRGGGDRVGWHLIMFGELGGEDTRLNNSNWSDRFIGRIASSVSSWALKLSS